MAKIYNIHVFEFHLISRRLADNSFKAFVSDIQQFLDSNLDPESYLEDLKLKGCTNSTLMRKRDPLINYHKFKEEQLDLAPVRVEQLIKDIAHKGNIKKSIHQNIFRHTGATLYLKNANIENIRRMLGHASLSTMQKYLQFTNEEVAKDLSRANW